MDIIKKHFIPNTGTLIILGIFLLIQTVKANNFTENQALRTTSTLLSYQGMLTNSSGVPVNGNVDMTFKIYQQASGGTAFWAESYTGVNAVSVNNGQFHVLLGSLIALSPTDLTGDLFLGITVNGEEMTPREQLTAVTYAMQANILTANAQVQGNLNMDYHSILNTVELRSPLNGLISVAADSESYANGWPKGGRIWLSSVNHPVADWRGTVRINIMKDLTVGNSPYFDVQRLQSDGNVARLFLLDEAGNGYFFGNLLSIGTSGIGEGGEVLLQNGSSGNGWSIDNFYGTLRAHHDGLTYMQLDSAGNLSITGDGLSLGSGTALLRQDAVRILHLLPNGGPGNPWDAVCIGCGSSADLVVNGNVSCGGLTEANLQTETEQVEQTIIRFEQGDVLCWSSDHLEKCSISSDRMIQAVANENGKPIVIGAEVIKVIGPVHMGDLLVASDTPGYAVVNNNPRPGTVIAQALEDFYGAQGLIKAMIRKL